MENHVQTLIIGAGAAGLACALRLKTLQPDRDVVVLDKAESAGNHNLSGAVLETATLEQLLDGCVPKWRDDPMAGEVLARRVKKDNILFLPSKKTSIELSPFIRLAGSLRLNIGQMAYTDNAIVSVSRLCKWLVKLAQEKGVNVLYGMSAKEILWDEKAGKANGVTLVDQGLQSDGSKLVSYLKGETITADTIVLAEGCDGLLTEQFIKKAGLERRHPQLFTLGVKELFQVSEEKYKKFGSDRVVHAIGYPVCLPISGPVMFGGGILYAMGENRIAVGLLVGLDWKEKNFNPQDAMQVFKQHSYINKYIDGGKIIAAGAKMIPEGGWRALPRDSEGSIGTSNVVIVGDAAGFVNMIKIKGLHNALHSGILAGEAVAENSGDDKETARVYTQKLSVSNVEKEMRSASKFRQVITKFGPIFGYPAFMFSGLLPNYKVEEDYKAMTTSMYRMKALRPFDKTTYTALAGTRHREGQPSHLTILDREICDKQCKSKFQAPCITFCPAGVYEDIHGWVKPANPSNCFHCKTCQRKCPFNNIRWSVPEGEGGPRYMDM